MNLSVFDISAQNKTRTCTTLRSLVPETSVSTNFTIWAVIFILKSHLTFPVKRWQIYKKSTFNSFVKMDFYISPEIYIQYMLIWFECVIFSQYLHFRDMGSLLTTLKQVVIRSLLVIHFGLKHLTIPEIKSGISTTFFSTTS